MLSGVMEGIAKEDFREFKPHAKVGAKSWYQRGIEVSSSLPSFPFFSLVPLAERSRRVTSCQPLPSRTDKVADFCWLES